MVNKDLNNTAKILVKVDQNNLVYVDPNSVIRGGVVEQRNIEQEKLVMYVNLEADLVPRSYLLSDTNTARYVSIVNKTFNLLTPQNGSDLNTDWSDSYNPEPHKNKNQTLVFDKKDFNDSSGQAFGVESITITVKGTNFIPQININFIDVRGKTLFEQPNDSPYNTFFHLPWPIFYLTIKGYYGKAVRYRLHLVKFSSKYNQENGNFEIATNFIGSTYAYLNDIPLNGIINAPYLFASKTEKTKTFNEQKGLYSQELKRSSKGYMMLKSVYAEMIQKKLLPEDFPVITLRELEILAMSLDKILEKEIFDQVIDPRILAHVESFNNTISQFIKQIEGWISQNLHPISFASIIDPATKKKTEYFFFLEKINATSPVKIINKDKTDTLESIIYKYSTDLNKIVQDINAIEITKIDKKENVIKTHFSLKTMKDIKSYYGYVQNTNVNQDQYGIIRDLLLSDVYGIQNQFYMESSKVMKDLELNVNRIIKDKNKGGLGFDPTIKNLFAILLANAEVYIRMTKDVHARAFNASGVRKAYLEPFSKDETKKNDCIYPWPEVKKEVSGGRTKVIAYPGEMQLRSVLKSYNKELWPEVDFIEQFIRFETKVDGVEKIDYIFSKSDEENILKSICTIFDSLSTVPYSNRTLASFLYEIYERSKQLTLVDSFDTGVIQELAKIEFDNLKVTLENEIDIVGILRNNVKTPTDLIDLMEKFSPFEKYSYLQDSIPTTQYIYDTLNEPFNIEKFEDIQKPTHLGIYDKIENSLKSYQPESYRLNLYPYSSDTYRGYIFNDKYYLNNFDYNNIFTMGTENGFITTPIDAKMWVIEGNEDNLFTQNLIIKDTKVNILNTSYFHNQLFKDFNNSKTTGKYAGSSYLLLNSLPFKDLEDYIVNPNTKTKTTPKLRMAAMFKEIGATHFVPYFLILKWGSIYHRYKNFILNDIDILDGFINGTTIPIDTAKFFDNDNLTGMTFDVHGNDIKADDGLNTGFHPFYDAVFHQIVNGYTHYDVTHPEVSLKSMIDSGYTICNSEFVHGSQQWSSYVDNSKYTSTNKYFTLLPSYGYNNDYNPIKDWNNDEEQQNAFRIVWKYEKIIDSFSGKTFSSYGEYIRSTSNEFSIESNNKKIIDLIGTFRPEILDQFEEIFLYFASPEFNEQVPQYKFPNLPYNTFQSILKEIVRVENFQYTDEINLRRKISENQTKNFKKITQNIISNKNLLKLTLGNPKEINSYVFEGFAGVATGSTFTCNEYLSSQLTTDTQNLIKLYIGEFTDTGINYYEEFFLSQNIELNETNILNFRSLILIYAGFRKSGNLSSTFQNYIKENIYQRNGYGATVNGANGRLSYYLTTLINNFSNLTITKSADVNVEFVGGYNNEGLKLELYNYFKSFNDKWASGNSLGQKLLLEEFLFLDKANRDIGDRGYINLERFISLLDTKNANTSLYGAISILLQGSGFDLRALPAYVNFYGQSLTKKNKITPSSTVAENLFGTFLDVDCEDSEPKIIIQYVEGPLSKHPDITNSSYNKFNDDSFDISDNNNNPIIITDPKAFTVDTLSKSNRAVAFEVSFGDQNQSIFKGVTLSQDTLRNTTESFGVLENLARSETGAGVYNIDTALFEYYRQASYSCEVSAMGNMMIQPTMFFYLKNIPMYKGSYWITEVTHSLKNNTINTTFKGTRIPRSSLPDPMDSFVSSYRPIMDKIIQKAISTVKKEGTTTMSGSTEMIIDNKITDPGKLLLNGENFTQLAGITDFGLPYNGYGGEKYIQKVNYKGNPGKPNEWFRARVVKMINDTETGLNKISDDTYMNILSNISGNTSNPPEIYWRDLKGRNINGGDDFYTTRFVLTSHDKPTMISKKTTTFLNPNKNDKTVTVSPSYNLNRPIKVSGAVAVGPNIDGYGIAMSNSLMKKLDLFQDDVVYFKFSD